VAEHPQVAFLTDPGLWRCVDRKFPRLDALHDLVEVEAGILDSFRTIREGREGFFFLWLGGPIQEQSIDRSSVPLLRQRNRKVRSKSIMRQALQTACVCV
jgi:hypothetical protein